MNLSDAKIIFQYSKKLRIKTSNYCDTEGNALSYCASRGEFYSGMDQDDKYDYLFGEDQSRYIIEVKHENFNMVKNILRKNSVFFENIGVTQKENLEIENEFKINVAKLYKSNTIWFKNYFK